MIRISKLAAELTPDERETLSRLVGRDVQQNDRVVVEVDSESKSVSHEKFGELPGWCDVLEGLNDEQVAEFDRILKYERPVFGRWEPEPDENP